MTAPGLPAVTMSIGATIIAAAATPDGIWHAIARADRNMYTAKHAGGQRLHVTSAELAYWPWNRPPGVRYPSFTLQGRRWRRRFRMAFTLAWDLPRLR